jgi:hypothetical protein
MCYLLADINPFKDCHPWWPRLAWPASSGSGSTCRAGLAMTHSQPHSWLAEPWALNHSAASMDVNINIACIATDTGPSAKKALMFCQSHLQPHLWLTQVRFASSWQVSTFASTDTMQLMLLTPISANCHDAKGNQRTRYLCWLMSKKKPLNENPQ